MKCRSCGAEVSAGTKVCPYCDNIFESNDADKLSAVNKKVNISSMSTKPLQQYGRAVPPKVEFRKGWGYLVLIPVIFLFVVSINASTGSSGEDVSSQFQGTENAGKINIVKNGCPSLIPNITFEEAYETFFANPDWRYFVADDEEESEIVEFVGDCTYDGEDAEVYIQFLLYDETDDLDFELYYAGIKQNDVVVDSDNSIIIELIYKPFSDYAENVLGEPLSDEVEKQFELAYRSALYDNSLDNTDFSNSDVSGSYEEDGYGNEYEDYYEENYEEGDKDYYKEENYEDNIDEYLEDYDEEKVSAKKGEYILQNSSNRKLTKSDLKNLSKKQLRLARNEIYARHGRIFEDTELQNYFESQSWYEGTIPAEEFFDSEELNAIERKNILLIKKYENK